MFNDTKRIEVLEGHAQKMLHLIESLANRIEAFDSRIEILDKWVKEVSDVTVRNGQQIVTIFRDNAESAAMSAASSEKLAESLFQDALVAGQATVKIACCERELKILTEKLEELSVRLESVEIKTGDF